MEFNANKIAEQVKGLEGKELVYKVNELCRNSKNVTGGNYVHINTRLMQVRIDQSYQLLAARMEKVFSALGYGINLDCRELGTVMY